MSENNLHRSNFPVYIPSSWGDLRTHILERFPGYDSSNTWFINVYGGIGDVLPILGYLHEFKKMHKVKYLGIIARSQIKDLVSLFSSNFDFVAYMSEDFVPPRGIGVDFGPNELICPSKKYVHDGFWHDFAVSNRVPLFDWYKLGLRLPMHVVFKFPEENRQLIKREVVQGIKGIEFENSVLLFPFTNFGPRLDRTIWQTIASELEKKGLSVYTNIQNSSSTKLKMGQKNTIEDSYQPIEGTNPISLSLSQLICICDEFRDCISGSGGVAFMLGAVGAKTTVLYHDHKRPAKYFNSTASNEMWTHLDMFDSVKRNLPDNENIREFLVDNNFLESISERFNT